MEKNRKRKITSAWKSMIAIFVLSIWGNIKDLKKATVGFQETVRFLAGSVRTDEGRSLQIILLGAGLYFLFLKLECVPIKGKREKIILYMVSCLFSFTLHLGTSFQLYNNWELIFLNQYTMVIAVGCVLLEGIFIYDIVKFIYYFVEKRWIARVCQEGILTKNRLWSKILNLWIRHLFLFPLFFVLTLWLPYLIVLFPGTITYDSMGQLKQAVGLSPLNDHHPIAMTYYYKGFILLGYNLFGSYNAGLFIHNIVQVALFLNVIAYFSYSLWRMKINSYFAY